LSVDAIPGMLYDSAAALPLHTGIHGDLGTVPKSRD
jgi:hypothetical protein